MMRHTSKGFVLAGVVACAGAMRSKVDLESGSIMQVVDHISSLLGRENVEIRRIAESVAAQSTPGVDGHFKASLKKVVDTIGGTLQPRVQEAHDGTQKKINKALTAVQTANRLAVEHKAAADKKDQEWFSCVAQELEKKEFHETGGEKLAAAQKAEQEALAKQQKNKDFTFTAADEYKFDFKCDNSIEGDCKQKMEAFAKNIREVKSDAKEQHEAKDKYYDDLVADGKTKVSETAAASKAMESADDAHEEHREKCEALKQERVKTICEYGDAVQSKGTDEAKFKQLLASVEGTGTEESEADRQKEWASLVASSCMVKRSIALGMKGPVSAEDMKACSAEAVELALEQLSKQADEFKTLTESHPCVAGPISFSNGEEWKVQGGLEYIHKATGCVNGQNIKKYAGKTVEECKKICDANPACKAFEFGVNYGGSGGYKPGDCQPQRSAKDSSCDGKHHNLDLYVKGDGRTEADSEDYAKQAFTPALNPTDGEQPFEMCPQVNQEKWRGVVVDEKAAQH